MASICKNVEYRTVITEKDVAVYRVFGGNAEAGGGFATTIPSQSALQTRIESAPRPEWNTIQYEAKIVVPEGTILNIGIVEEQGIADGILLEGGGDQILLPPNWDLNWIQNIRVLEYYNEL